jgi:RNA-binding protein YhbY
MTPRAYAPVASSPSTNAPPTQPTQQPQPPSAVSFHSGDTVPTIREMRRIIIESLDIDRFITLQNGTLIDVFFNKKTEMRESDRAKYKTSNIYRQFNPELFHKICNAYENFISYLDDDNVIIDHTYLWDIISQPNERLFKNGNNLILLQIPDDDITNNVQVICPTNAYSGEVFDANKKTIIVMKRDKYYEPIYLFESKSNGKFNVLGRFAIKSKTIMPKIKHVIENIRDIYFTYCRLHASQPRQYKYVMNKPAKQIAKLLTDAGFIIQSQVVNYNGKVIGLHISQTITTTKIKQTKTVPKETTRKMIAGVIPTAVSAPLVNTAGPAATGYEYSVVMMDNDDLWHNSYHETVEFLNIVADKVKKMTKQTVNCRPKVKVVEDGLIVGVITETNQFIQVNVNIDPTQNQDDDLPTITEGNHLKADKEIMTAAAEAAAGDKSRERYVRNIRLETNFYNVFRNTARNILNRPENRAIKDEIEKIISSTFVIYTNKLSQIIALMKRITVKYIAFIRYSKETLKLVGEVSGCVTRDHETCGQKSYCLKEAGGLCKLLLPQRNLMYPDIDNEIAYFGKLSDEMIRYERVKLFMFEPAKYLTFKEIKYNLNDDEIILLESLITQEYFDNLDPVDANPYALQTTFYTVNPNENTGVLLQRYDNTYRKTYIDRYLEGERDVEKDERPGAAVAVAGGVAAPPPLPESEDVAERFKVNEINHVLGFCNDVSKRKVTEKMRQLFFPAGDTYEILFSNESEECSFDVILTILRGVAAEAGGGAAAAAAESAEPEAAEPEPDICRKCRASIGKDQTEFGCYQCNYFVCDHCQHQHVDQLGGMNIAKLKDILISEYGKLSRTPTFDKKITRILNGYGMKKYAELITAGRATLPQIIQSQNYFLTNVDIWILALYFKLPIAFISQSLLIENGRNVMILYGNESLDSYFFIHPFGVTQDVISRYGLIEKKLDEETSVLKIPMDYLTAELRDTIIRELDEPKSLEQYISEFKITNVKTKGRTLVVRKAEEEAGGGGGGLEPDKLPPAMPAMPADIGKLIAMTKISEQGSLFQ